MCLWLKLCLLLLLLRELHRGLFQFCPRICQEAWETKWCGHTAVPVVVNHAPERCISVTGIDRSLPAEDGVKSEKIA